jgi:hypothetical protein
MPDGHVRTHDLEALQATMPRTDQATADANRRGELTTAQRQMLCHDHRKRADSIVVAFGVLFGLGAVISNLIGWVVTGRDPRYLVAIVAGGAAVYALIAGVRLVVGRLASRWQPTKPVRAIRGRLTRSSTEAGTGRYRIAGEIVQHLVTKDRWTEIEQTRWMTEAVGLPLVAVVSGKSIISAELDMGAITIVADE